MSYFDKENYSYVLFGNYLVPIRKVADFADAGTSCFKFGNRLSIVSSIYLLTILRKIKEIEELRGGVLRCAAQAILRVDGEIS